MPLSEARDTLADLAQRLDALGGTFDVPGLELALDRLNHQTSAEGFWDDPERAQKVVQERATIEGTVQRQRTLEREVKDLGELLDMASSEGDASMIEDVVTQIPDLERRVRQAELARMLSKPEDRSDAIVYINPGAGGVDAQDWAEMLFRMYLRWCEQKGFKAEVLDHQPGEEAGIKDASIAVRGPYAYGYLKAETGVHRLIRISPFDSNARRHTAFAAVHVVPEVDDEIEVDIKKEDLEVDTMRAGGKGGQHVNKTESAIRITHVPTGIIVKCSAERSQHKNRSTAMKMLRSLLYQRMQAEREAEFAQSYESGKQGIQFGSQIRTYTLQPYQLVKDERTEHKSSNPQAVLDGDLDEFIEAYLLTSADQKSPAEKKQEGDRAEGA
ncbi:MAG: peptide chain release factor 2 [Sandaracinaceae bacterium]|nr:peptide chain release factor 2 [Sandaracinaceae bacterium]